MPRLPPSLIRSAHSLHPLLPRLLRPCRDLESARNELRWLREHAIHLDLLHQTKPESGRPRWQHKLSQLCRERERGKPLQYVIGLQPFGDLEILCRRGVLTPRPETESMTNHLASLLPSLLKSHESPHPHLRILDLCTGTGCISLLLHSLLSSPKIPPQVCGIDISSTAINLAQENLAHNIRLGHLEPIAQEQIDFIQDDIFSDSKKPWRTSSWDVIISNPPYISPNSFNNTTSRSVRNYEPKAALVPPQTVAADSVHDDTVGDMFYPRLLKIAHNANAKLVLMEVADMAQATRVVEMVLEKGIWGGCEIWRDEPSSNPRSMGERVVIRGRDVEVKGEGNGRGVLVWRKDRDISIH